jgi:hypothetical protein
VIVMTFPAIATSVSGGRDDRLIAIELIRTRLGNGIAVIEHEDARYRVLNSICNVRNNGDDGQTLVLSHG